MKGLKTKFLAALLGVVFAVSGMSIPDEGVGGVVPVNHGGPVLTVVEGEAFTPTDSSYCKAEEDAIAVIDAFRIAGFPASIAVFEEFLVVGRCFNVNIPVTVTPIRLVDQFKHAVVVEVETPKGVRLFFVAPRVEYVLSGQPTGQPV